MGESVRLLWGAVLVVGIMACGFPRPADVGDPPRDGQSIDAAPPLPSCGGLATTCGASGTDSCCNSPEVVGGIYYRSYDVASDANSGTASYPATISSFRLDKYEVTVGRFRAFVRAGMATQSNPPIARAGAHANIPGSGWDPSWNMSLVADTVALIAAVKCDSTFQTWTDTPGANENRPMNCITWYEAMAFCAWDDGYLPTEAEWNYAAAGGDQQRAYPWSNPAASLALDGAHASYLDPMLACVGDGMRDCSVYDLVMVGTKPAGEGRWGQSDLAGNVLEWTLDWDASYATPCTDCANLTPASNRMTRGGSFDLTAKFQRASYRSPGTPTIRYYEDGVRCARSAP
jgi:formylglycine-generating enzyme